MAVSRRFLDRDALLCRVRARWPGVAFCPEHLHPGASHCEELCLALAAAASDALALAAIDREFLRDAVSRAARLAPSPDFGDDVAQALRERLFLTGPEKPARIGQYDGSSPLAVWLRVIARHCAIDLLRARPKQVANLDDHLDRLVQPGTPELDFVQERFRNEFRRALTEAVQTLGSRDGTALRLHLRDGVPLEGVAAAYGVHRATAARWIATARATVLSRTRQNLSRLLGASEADIESILRVARSNLDVSISGVFRRPAAA